MVVSSFCFFFAWWFKGIRKNEQLEEDSFFVGPVLPKRAGQP
jgi:hypothetical protein